MILFFWKRTWKAQYLWECSLKSQQSPGSWSSGSGRDIQPHNSTPNNVLTVFIEQVAYPLQEFVSSYLKEWYLHTTIFMMRNQGLPASRQPCMWLLPLLNHCAHTKLSVVSLHSRGFIEKGWTANRGSQCAQSGNHTHKPFIILQYCVINIDFFKPKFYSGERGTWMMHVWRSRDNSIMWLPGMEFGS